MMREPPVGVLLRAWRERALLTQERLAHLAGLGVRTVRRMESDEPLRPRIESLRLLADVLRLDETERAILVGAARGRVYGRVPSGR